jgi:hypothetical protein
MKKIILSLAAVLVFGIASAQTEPKQEPQITPPPPPKTVIKETKPVKDAEIQNDAVSKQPKMEGEVQPRRDELKTQDHVKSTPDPATVKDTVRPVKKAKMAKVKKS